MPSATPTPTQGWLPACKKRASSGPPPAAGQPLQKRPSHAEADGGDTNVVRESTTTTTTVTATPRTPVFVGPADEKLYKVAANVQCTKDVPEACQDMLYGLCFDSLGPAQGERDDLQQEACGLIGRALRINESYLMDLVRAAEQKVAVEQQKYDELNHVLTGAQAAKDATAVEVKVKLEEKRRLQHLVEEARGAFQRAKDEHTKASMDLRSVMKEKSYMDEAYYKRFLILKEGGLTEPMIKGHLDVLNPLLQSWGAEDSLIASFGKAARHDVRERMRWSESTFGAVEEFFHPPMEEIEKKLVMKKSHEEQCLREVESMQASYNQTLADAEAADAAVLAAQGADEKAAVALNTANMALAQQRRLLQDVQGDLQKRHLELKRFQEGPLADYHWLLDHTGSERYTSRSGTSPPIDAQAAEKIKEVCRALDLCHLNARCKSMLAGAAPGSLGVAARSRDEFQTAAAQLILRALTTHESALCAHINDWLQHFDSVDLMDMGSLKSTLQSAGLQNPDIGVAAAEKLVQEKCEVKLKSSQQYLVEKKAAMDKANQELSVSEKELQAALRNKQHYDDAFNKYFVPIRDGTAVGSTGGNIEQLTQLLQSWNTEECLIACFRAAALHQPQDRGAWCKDTIVEVERAFGLPIRQAEELAMQCKEAVQQRQMMRESLKVELDDAQLSLKVAQEQCRVAKKVHLVTMELRDFRLGPMEFVKH